MSAHDHDKNPFVLVLFGATGDLAKRKLFPALYSMYRGQQLNPNFAVIGVGRSEMNGEEYQKVLRNSIDEYSRQQVTDEADWKSFIQRFTYIAIDVQDSTSYKDLLSMIQEQEKTHDIPGNRMFYLALAPSLFGIVSTNLKTSGISDSTGWKRLIIEKPFGHDFESAKLLNEQIQHSFKEEEIYRIDHYLGKEMVQNIEV